MKVTVTVNFLRSESDNSLLLQFWLFQQGSKNFFSLLPNIIYYFSGAIKIFPGAVYICHKFNNSFQARYYLP